MLERKRNPNGKGNTEQNATAPINKQKCRPNIYQVNTIHTANWINAINFSRNSRDFKLKLQKET